MDDRLNLLQCLDDVVEDDDDDSCEPAPARYDITSFGADYDVDGIVRRLRKGDIIVPDFQREYVWRQPEASRFVESLLLGLPVPGVFLAREAETQRLLVIDGQQRLKTLQFFYDGFFNPIQGESKHRVFELTKVQKQFSGLTYAMLQAPDRLRLDNAIIHATVVKQDSPPDEDTSIYHIFQRLNSGGRLLAPQEIRSVVYHGPFVQLLHELNQLPSWRSIFGKASPRLKDEELILRFLALREQARTYSQPMSEFLNRFAAKHRVATASTLGNLRSAFSATIDLIAGTLGNRVFRPSRGLNAAVYDSVTVALSLRLDTAPIPHSTAIKTAYDALLKDSTFMDAISRSTANETSVQKRLQIATDAFSHIQ